MPRENTTFETTKTFSTDTPMDELFRLRNVELSGPAYPGESIDVEIATTVEESGLFWLEVEHPGGTETLENMSFDAGDRAPVPFDIKVPDEEGEFDVIVRGGIWSRE